MRDIFIKDCKGEVFFTEHNSVKRTDTPQGQFFWGDVLELLDRLVDDFENKIQLFYMDPPFATGQTYKFKQRVGSSGWQGNGRFILNHIAYDDQWKEGKESYFLMMRQVLEAVYRMLSPEGSVYLHVDYRTSAYLKIMMDEIFGENNFLNEIIWHYQTGGRSKKHFSRKHDTILFYRKSSKHFFDLEAVGKPRGKGRRNHMKRQIDKDGREYYSIRSGGKEYRYYEDSKVFPSDVWNDISHLHQKDPERTGYDTQKPESLLKRIILSSSRPGDLVADIFAGSGTTLAVAHKNNRRWIGIDQGIFSLHCCRKRLLDISPHNRLEIIYMQQQSNEYFPNIRYRAYITNSCEINVELLDYRPSSYSAMATKKTFIDDIKGLDWIDYWAVGCVKEGLFYPYCYSYRNFDHEIIQSSLKLILPYNSIMVIHIADVLGEQYFIKADVEIN